MAVGENSFDDLISGERGDPNISHTKNHVRIDAVNIYEFMGMAYEGNGHFRDGRFLIPHSREMFYDSRRELAYYKNFVQPIVNATYVPVFNGDIARTVDPDSSMFSDFIENVDNAGTNMQDFMRSAMKMSRLNSVAFIIMENYPEEQMPLTLADARGSRIFPYVYTKAPQTVDDYQTDRFGNIMWISFLDRYEKNNKGENEKIYRIWTTTESHEAKRKPNNDGKRRYGLDQYVILSTVVHGLGIAPVVPVFSRKPDDCRNLLPDPMFYDVARINHAIYNKDSEVRDQERAQGFAVLAVQSDNSGNFTVSPHNVIFVPVESTNMPQYVSPDSAILEGLVKNGNELRDDLFRIAEQLGVVGVKTEASGIALGYRFFGHETVLKHTSQVAQSAEDKIAMLFRLYTGEDFEYTAEYPDDFQPVDMGGEVDTLDKYMMQELTPVARTLAMQKMTRIVLGDQDPDRVQEVVDSFAEQQEEMEAARQASREAMANAMQSGDNDEDDEEDEENTEE